MVGLFCQGVHTSTKNTNHILQIFSRLFDDQILKICQKFYKKINYSTKTVIFIHNNNFFTEDFTKFILTLYCLV